MLEARRLAVDRESSTWQGKSSTNNIRQPPQTPLRHHMSAMRPGILNITYCKTIYICIIFFY